VRQTLTALEAGESELLADAVTRDAHRGWTACLPGDACVKSGVHGAIAARRH